MAGSNIRLGRGAVAVTASRSGDAWRPMVDLDASVRRLWIGHTLPRDAEVRSVDVGGEPSAYRVRRTNRGLEVTAPVAEPAGRHEVTIRTR